MLWYFNLSHRFGAIIDKDTTEELRRILRLWFYGLF